MRRAPARAWFILYHGVESVVETAGTREAAQVAFFILISFPAALLLIVWGASTLLDDIGVRSEIVDGIVEALPLADDEGRGQVEDLLDGVARGAGTLGLLGGLALIWASSGAIGALRHSIVNAWPSGDPEPYFPGKALDVGLTLLVAPLGVAALGLNLVVDVPEALIDQPAVEGLVGLLITVIVPIVAVFLIFLILFRILPTADASLRSAWPGALVALAGAGLVRVGSDLWFGSLGGESAAIYGAIASLIAASISVYLVAIVAVFGANVSALLARYPSFAAIDRAIAADAENPNPPLLGEIGRLLRSLFIRRRAKKDET
ncbi:MAG: YihY/virulence factor BrkB family protein [Solirubrobacterales bacterium]